MAAFAMSAIAAVPALAEETPKEFSEWQAFIHCPLEEIEISGCIYAQSTYKEVFLTKALAEEYHATHPERHSEFHAGNVNVQLRANITLQGAFNENEETGEQHFLAAVGAPTLSPVAQKAPSLSKDVNKALLSPSELNRYRFYISHKITKTTATVELAGPGSSVRLNEEHLLRGEGTAIGLPVKVKLSNPFFGEACYVGSDENPIQIELSSGKSGALEGKLGYITTTSEARILKVNTDTIVDNQYAAPGVTGCGIEGGADEAMNSALGLPSPSGANTAVIDGLLEQTGIEAAREKLG